MSELEDFNRQIIADIQGEADVDGLVTVEAFFEKVGELLTEVGELNGADRAYYEGKVSGQPARIDGYGGDPRDGDGVLSLVLCDFDISPTVRIIHKDRLQVLANTLHRFLKASLKRNFREQLEETSTGFGVADLIHTVWKETEKIKLIIVTNADARVKADTVKVAHVEDKQVTLSLWDLKRLKQYVEQGLERGNLVVDFEKDFGGGLPLLLASEGTTSLESYLAVVPGSVLAEIYDKWGPRLLEANVRSFLQARGKVNKGIRDAIRNEPHMFFPYNNGLSATADFLEVRKTGQGLQLVRAENLQIVNGGQTTASIHAARKNCAEQLKQVRVQIKLTTVPREQSEQVVPRISEYSNSQNKVNLADFFANHPFQIRTEELSRRILSRVKDGYRDTKWFYERARGQFADERGRRTPAERRNFDAEYPRSQFFTKTELAKVENTWIGLPHIVSLGAQKNFAEFAKNMGKRWSGDGQEFNETWYRRTIAKVIVFRATERLVSNANWYAGGYRANIVSYAIAKLVLDVKHRKQWIDLDSIWQQQEIALELKDALMLAGAEAQEVITKPPAGIRNCSEWAKKEVCWKRLLERELEYDAEFERVLISTEIAAGRERESRTGRNIEKSIDLEMEVYRKGPEFWTEIQTIALQNGKLTAQEKASLEQCRAMPKKIPNTQQCKMAMKVLKRLDEQGFLETKI